MPQSKAPTPSSTLSGHRRPEDRQLCPEWVLGLVRCGDCKGGQSRLAVVRDLLQLLAAEVEIPYGWMLWTATSSHAGPECDKGGGPRGVTEHWS